MLVPTKFWYGADADRHQLFVELTEKTTFAKGIGLPGRVLQSGEAEWIVDVQEDPNFPRAEDTAAAYLRGACAFPIKIGGRCVSVLEFFKDEAVTVDAALLSLMTSIGEQVGRVLERAESEEALRESEESTRAIVSNVIDGIITIDDSGIIRSVNPAAELVFGYPAGEVIGQNVSMLMPEPFRREHDGYLRNYLETGEAKIIGIDREVVGRRKDGRPPLSGPR